MSADSSADFDHVAKRARLDIHEPTHSPIVGVLDEDGDDADSEFYGKDDNEGPQGLGLMLDDIKSNEQPTISTEQAVVTGGAIPGLFLATATDSRDKLPTRDTAGTPSPSRALDQVSAQLNTETMNIEATLDQAPIDVETTPKGETATSAKYNEIGDSAMVNVKNREGENEGETAEAPKADSELVEVKPEKSEVQIVLKEFLSKEKAPKKPLDSEFLALAEANKNDENAEWRFDSSDAESSVDDSSDSGSDEDEEEGEGYSSMKPEEIATLLLQEIDEGEKSAPGPLRTKNEVPEEYVKVERLDIKVTAEMKVEVLGTVDSIVDNMVLIRASVSGDYRVLSEGSLLVLEDRSVIGAVADTLGRIEEPLYTVRFNSPTEMKELNVEIGKKIFYVPDHASYVFTQPLLAQKGSDASNIHDEETGDAEIEFSDDEAEAEYKRKLKEARKNTEKNKNPQDTNSSTNTNSSKNSNSNSKKSNRKSQAIVNTDEPYVPLQRPANLHEMVAQPPPPPPSAHFEGRGGRNRNRNDRNFGRSSRGNDRGRGRGGGRGGGGDHGRRNRNRGGYRDGSSPSPQRTHKDFNRQKHNGPPPQRLQAHGQRRRYSPAQDNSPAQNQSPPSQFNFGSQSQQHQPTPQFSQFPFQPYQQPYPTMPSMPPAQNMPLPSGAHVNPAFFGTSQPAQAPALSQEQHSGANWLQTFQQQLTQQQLTQQQVQQANPAPYNEDAFKALQNTLDMLKAQQQQQNR